MATPPLEYSAASHTGLVRDNNEDCFLSLPEQGLWLVADGMGGHEAGEVASALARDTFAQQLQQTPNTPLPLAMQKAHEAILAAAASGIGAAGMGTTLIALRSQYSDYEIAWVGDSRAYLWQRPEHKDSGQLQLLSRDHSYVQQLVSRGLLSDDQAHHHPQKNVITQCLGMQGLQQLEVGSLSREWQPGQWLLLCSDGLSDELSDETLSRLLSQSDSPNSAVDKLLKAALEQGGRDNITLQIIQSPRQQGLLDRLWPWVPQFTHSKHLDAWIFTSALLALLGLLYYIINGW